MSNKESKPVGVKVSIKDLRKTEKYNMCNLSPGIWIKYKEQVSLVISVGLEITLFNFVDNKVRSYPILDGFGDKVEILKNVEISILE